MPRRRRRRGGSRRRASSRRVFAHRSIRATLARIESIVDR
jgi:hypothetical protein